MEAEKEMNAVPKTLRFLTFALLIVSGTSTAQPIDLRSVVNMGLQDEFDGDQKGGWTDQGANDMRNFPVGEQEFHGITFNIIDPKTNGGKAALVMYGKDRPYFPKRVAISFNTKARTLYFLQAAAWCPSSGEKVADYRLEYLDGEEILVPIVAGAALTNWWDPYPTSDSTVGWVGSNPVGKNVGVNLFWLENPRPEKVIKQIVVQSTGKGVLCILGITASSQELATEFRKPKEDKYRLATEDWFPFELPWDQGPVKGSALDRSFLLDPPAGKHGFLKAQGEQFVFADGTNARFWGVNFSAGANFPTHQQAEKIAERLAGYGINIVRMHHLDAGWTEPNIFDDSYNDTQHLSAESLDRMDYLIYCLKQEGIYVYLDQLVTRYFKPGDEVGIDLPAEPRLKGYTNFVPRLIELQKKYSHDLWTHRNPYTKLRYCDDPAIALMEITNEDDLFTNRNSLLSIFAFGDILKQKWSVWREKQGLQAAAIPIDINDGTFLRFLNDLQIEYYQEMIAYLRALGVKAPITGTNWSRWLQDQPSHAVCDFNDAHAYWDHPADDYTVLLNEPMLKSMKTSFDYMSFCALEGKPFFVSEWDHPWPNFYRAEATAWTAAIAGLQGWNGLALYTYRHNADQAVKHIAGAFETFNDPCYMGLMPTAALLYLRGDVNLNSA